MQSRLINARRRRVLVACLRRAVSRATGHGRFLHRSGLLLCDRVVAVHSELLETADLLEQAHAPDPWVLDAVQQLLTDGCESPLFNRSIHPSELRATLYLVRSRLTNGSVRRLSETGISGDPSSPRVSPASRVRGGP